MEWNDTQQCCRNYENQVCQSNPRILPRTMGERVPWGIPPSCAGSGWHGRLQSSAGLSPSSGVLAKSVSHDVFGNWYSVQRPAGNYLGIFLFFQRRQALGGLKRRTKMNVNSKVERRKPCSVQFKPLSVKWAELGTYQLLGMNMDASWTLGPQGPGLRKYHNVYTKGVSTLFR